MPPPPAAAPPPGYAHLRVSAPSPPDGGIRVVRFDKPGRKNALGLQEYKDLTRAFREAEEDEQTKILVLTGAYAPNQCWYR